LALDDDGRRADERDAGSIALEPLDEAIGLLPPLRTFDAGPRIRGPSVRGPSGRGPSGRGPSNRGLSGRGPLNHGLSGRAPSNRGPSGRGPSNRGPSGRGPSARKRGGGPCSRARAIASSGSGNDLLPLVIRLPSAIITKNGCV